MNSPIATSDAADAKTAIADVMGTISRLMVYPVKSCAGVELREAVLTDTGLDLDRAWMVVDEAGEFVTQREVPRLGLVRPKLGVHEMVLRAPGMLALHVQIDAVEQPAQVRVWDDVTPAYDMGDVAAQWFTDFLSLSADGLPGRSAKKYRMVRFDPEHRRLSSLKWTGGVEAPNQFADAYPLLVLGEASLEDFNSRLLAAGHAAVAMERFRPNIVLAGLQAHDEDRVETLTVSCDPMDVVLKPVKPCARCSIPDLDPLTALPSRHVGDMLQTYRQDPRLDGAVTFGMNAIVLRGADAVLRLGQRVTGTWAF